ncbi:hypothetical protein KBC75_01940 [Candidatus Shapirobacteria bacterium]|nr:hypothetical protein [Candidatus Shapirobacteria bacterium]
MNKVLKSLSVLGKFWQEPQITKIFRWNLLTIILQIVTLLFKYFDLPPQIPLFYSQPWGESQLASNSFIILLPLFSLLILIINNLTAAFIASRSILFSRILTICSLIFSLIILYSIFNIVFLVS